jgi:hypothetical protein
MSHRHFLGLILHAGQATVDFEGWRQAFQPESRCRSDGSSQAVAQAVTDELADDELADELAVIRPQFERFDYGSTT